MRTHLEAVSDAPDDRTASGGNGVDRQPRSKQLQSGELGLLLHLTKTVLINRLHTEHIRGGAAHIESEHRLIAETGGSGHSHSTDHAGSGTGEDGVLGQQVIRGLERSAGGHHPQSG